MDIGIRNAQMDDLDRLMEIERLTFPPAEAAAPDVFAYRIKHFNKWFHVAVADDQIVGLINGRLTELDCIKDELYEPSGSSSGCNFALLCVETDPAWQKRGVAEKMIRHCIEQAKRAGVGSMLLACKDGLVAYYQKFGFINKGVSSSVHGGAVWNDMELTLAHLL